MPDLSTDDGVELYYEEIGGGAWIVFVHEFAGDYRSWEPQVRHFARRYRCISFDARSGAFRRAPGAGYGSEKAGREKFRNEAMVIAGGLTKGMAALADFIALVDAGHWPMRSTCDQPEHRGDEIANWGAPRSSGYCVSIAKLRSGRSSASAASPT